MLCPPSFFSLFPCLKQLSWHPYGYFESVCMTRILAFFPIAWELPSKPQKYIGSSISILCTSNTSYYWRSPDTRSPQMRLPGCKQIWEPRTFSLSRIIGVFIAWKLGTCKGSSFLLPVPPGSRLILAHSDYSSVTTWTNALSCLYSFPATLSTFFSSFGPSGGSLSTLSMLLCWRIAPLDAFGSSPLFLKHLCQPSVHPKVKNQRANKQKKYGGVYLRWHWPSSIPCIPWTWLRLRSCFFSFALLRVDLQCEYGCPVGSCCDSGPARVTCRSLFYLG